MKNWEIVKAWEEGKEIEVYDEGANQWNEDLNESGEFYFNHGKYRIKKQPVKFDSLVGRRIRDKHTGNVFLIIGENERENLCILNFDWRIKKDEININYELEDE